MQAARVRLWKPARTLVSFASRPRAATAQAGGKKRIGGQQLQMSASAAAAPSYRILQYDYVPDILEKRGPHREGHLKAANDLAGQGKCVLGGAAGNPVSMGLFIFKDMSEEDIKAFVESDPYMINGLVKDWRILPYMVAVTSS